MIVYAIDDEANALEYLTGKIQDAEPGAEIHAFDSARKALESAKDLPFEVAFMDIQMPGINGIELAKKFKAINPKCNLVFVTGYSEYTMDAFSLDASGYLLKPVTSDMIRHALDNLRYPLTVKESRVTIQCFGNFEIFCDGVPIDFKYSKSKEVLAYLVDRNGATCTNGDVIVHLWEDDEDHASYYRSLLKDIHDTLSALGCGDIIKKQWGGVSLLPSKVHCDYYDFLAEKPHGINAFHGEYMLQYSWAEETGASLLWEE